MLAAISKAFGFSSPPEQHPLMPRQINLSGNIFHFSIPENFSQDMPAENMIETVDLNDKAIYQDYQKFTLIRRWWDFKEKGYFGKSYGSIMMSMYIREVPEDLSKNILNPLDFIQVIMKKFEVSAKKNRESVYPDFYEAYSLKTANNQQWLNYSVEKPQENIHDINYAIQITDEKYLEVEFSFAPVAGVSVREFIDVVGRNHMRSIINSFEIDYAAGSNLPKVIEHPVDLEKLIEEKFY